MSNRIQIAQLVGRMALGISFLSAVADRFGLWGAPGEPNVFWGNWANFLDYTYLLVPYFGKAMADVAGTVATVAEVVLAIMLILGFRTRWAAWGSCLLLLVFGLSMMAALGIKTPFDYSVFTASAAALLLSAVPSYRWSVDGLS